MDSILLIRWHLNAKVTNAHHFSIFELLSSLKDMIVLDNPLNYNNVRGGKKLKFWHETSAFSFFPWPHCQKYCRSHKATPLLHMLNRRFILRWTKSRIYTGPQKSQPKRHSVNLVVHLVVIYKLLFY